MTTEKVNLTDIEAAIIAREKVQKEYKDKFSFQDVHQVDLFLQYFHDLTD